MGFPGKIGAGAFPPLFPPFFPLFPPSMAKIFPQPLRYDLFFMRRDSLSILKAVRLRQELEIRQLSKYNLPKWESEASDDEPLWKLVTNRKPGPPKVDIYLGNLPEEMTKEKVTKYIQRRAQSAGESPPTIFRCTVQNAKPQNDGTIKTYARLTIKKTDRDLVLDRGFWPPSLHAREWKLK